jgi:hypothetical protein
MPQKEGDVTNTIFSASETEFQAATDTEKAAGGGARAKDFVLVLDTGLTDKNLTKTIQRNPDGELAAIPYSKGLSEFNAVHIRVSNLKELAKVLDSLKPTQAVVCGKLVPELGSKAKQIPRLLYPRGENDPATIEPAEHFWVMMDVDGVECPAGLDPIREPERAARHIISLLPKEFHDAGFRWQLTSSAGLPGKPGIRMRMTFWLDRKLTGEDQKAWLALANEAAGKKILDLSIYTANQLIYAAPPILKDIEDPVPRRSGICEGRNVQVPELRPSGKRNKPGVAWGTKLSGPKSYREWRAAIGDHPNGHGFFEPVKHSAGAWIATNPMADTEPLSADLEAAIQTAVRDETLHNSAYIAERIRDLKGLIKKISAWEKAKPAPGWVEEINKDYAVVLWGGKTAVIHTGRQPVQPIDKGSFFDIFADRCVPKLDDDGGREPLGQAWFNHCRRRAYLDPGVIFEPGAPERPGAYNLWRGLTIEPRQGDWHLMEAHIHDILCDGNAAHAKFVLDWMAFKLQNPGARPETALLFSGAQGCGKGIVWNTYGELFGPHYQHYNDPEQATGKFNWDLGQSVFVLLDEASWGGDKKAANKLKADITEPTLTIERKGYDKIRVPNHLAYVACTNSDWGAPVEIGDRRWAAFKPNECYAEVNRTTPEKRAAAHAYFKALKTEIDKGGPAAMLYDLLRRPVTGDDIRNPPNTAEKARLKVKGFRSGQRWLYEALQVGEIPGYGDIAPEPWGVKNW